MRLQEHHHVPDGAVLGPGRADGLQFLLGDSGDFGQPADFPFEDIQCAVSEMRDDLFGGFRADSLDKPGAQILLQRGGGGRLFLDGLDDALEWLGRHVFARAR